MTRFITKIVKYLFFTILISIIFIFLIWVFNSFLGFIKNDSLENIKSIFAGKNPRDSLNWSLMFQFVQVFTIVAVLSEMKHMKDQSRLDMSHQLYLENTKFRNSHKVAFDELISLELEMIKRLKVDNNFKHRSNYDKFYSSEAYKNLRSVSHHFEYLGYMVKSENVHFDLVFDPITFPDWLFNYSMILRYTSSLFIPDFWDGIEYLYNAYEKERLKSFKKRVLNGNTVLRKLAFTANLFRFNSMTKIQTYLNKNKKIKINATLLRLLDSLKGDELVSPHHFQEVQSLLEEKLCEDNKGANKKKFIRKHFSCYVIFILLKKRYLKQLSDLKIDISQSSVMLKDYFKQVSSESND